MKPYLTYRRATVAASAAIALSAVLCYKLYKTPEATESAVSLPPPSGKPTRSERLHASTLPAKVTRANHVVVGSTEPIIPQWLAKHKIPIANLDDDANGDGISNRQHMMAGTDPFGGLPNPYPQVDPEIGQLSEEIGAPNLGERMEILRNLLGQAKKSDRKHLEDTKRETERLGIPMIQGNAVLDGFSSDGSPLYLKPSNIALAAC